MRPRVLTMRLFKRSSRRHVDHDQDVVDEAARAATVITGTMNGLAIEARPFFVGRQGLQDTRARCRVPAVEPACPLSPLAARTPPSPAAFFRWLRKKK